MKLTIRIKNSLYRQFARKYIASLEATYDPAKKTILALNHFYDQDLRALALANTGYNFIAIDAPRLVRGGKLYFSEPVIRMDAPYTAESEANRSIWRNECRFLLDEITSRFPVDIIIAPSDIFWWIREFIVAARERGIRTLVVDKEGLISPFDFEAEARRIRERAPFISDHIFVWSRRQKEYWNKIGVEDERITVLGQPRSDLFHHEHNRSVDTMFDAPRPLVTLFSYEDTAYIPPDQARRGLSWQRMKSETHEHVLRLAREHPEYNFVIKTHPQQSDLAALREKYYGGNLAVIGGSAVANELIQRSELNIAFQTTGVIEAMFMNRRVLYTCWDPTYAQLREDVLPFHDAPGIVVADTLDTFTAVCRRFFGGDHSDFEFSPEDLAARDRFVDTYLYRPDGEVCRRFFRAVDTLLA